MQLNSLLAQFNLLKQLAEERLCNFSARNLANAVWALAKLDHHPGHLMTKFCKEVLGKVKDCNAQNVANTLWALGTLGEWGGNKLQAMVVGPVGEKG